MTPCPASTDSRGSGPVDRLTRWTHYLAKWNFVPHDPPHSLSASPTACQRGVALSTTKAPSTPPMGGPSGRKQGYQREGSSFTRDGGGSGRGNRTQVRP